MFNIIISLLLLIDLLGMILVMLKNRKIFLAKNSIFLIPMVILMFVIYYTAVEYETGIDRFFESLSHSITAITFRNNFYSLKDVYKSDTHFVINYYINLSMIGFMSFSAIIDLFFKQVINFFKVRIKNKDSIVIITASNDSDALLLLKGSENKLCILSEANSDFERILMDNNVAYLKGINEKNIARFDKPGNKFISLLKNPQDIINLINLSTNLNADLYIEADDLIEGLIEGMLDKCFNIFLFNKYKLIGYDFLLNHSPYNSFSGYIDNNTSLLKKDKDINIFLIGFDNANKNIYLELIKNNQLAKLDGTSIKSYPVKYHIYTKNKADTLYLNHKLREIDLDSSKYFAPFEASFSYDIKEIDEAMYKNIIKEVRPNAMSIFIISDDNPYLSLDYANKLSSSLIDYDKLIYIRDPFNELSNTPYLRFGDEGMIITADNIINESLFKLAKKRAALYDSKNSPDVVWKGLSRDKRLSNISCIVSITHKLALMGLMISDDKTRAISRDEYFNIYDNHEEIEYDSNNKISYPIYFSKDINNRNTIAFIEHSRWNAEMLVKGYLPMPISLIGYKNNKLYKDDEALKLHSCITSFDGLDKYYDMAAKILMENKNISYLDAYKEVENKKYDYELMDNAYDLITSIGSYIVRR